MSRASKFTTLVMAVAASLAVASTASANWTHKGEAIPGGTNPSISLGGTIGFTSENGGIHCNNGTATIEATGGTEEGHLTSFGSEDPTKCEVSGGLAFLAGGTTSAVSTKLTFKPKIDLTIGHVKVTLFVYHIKFKNGLEITLTGDILLTPNNVNAVIGFTLSGSLSFSLGGTMTASGSMAVLPPNSGTYGIE